jgi:hypothetical protein
MRWGIGAAMAALTTAALGGCALVTGLSDLSPGDAAPALVEGGVKLEGGAGAVDGSGLDAPSEASPPDGGLRSDCRSLHAAEGTLADGIYTIDPDGAGPHPALRVYCDMSTADGGWTLVGRSAGASDSAFGWNGATGSVDDDSAPYSLGPATAGLTFGEVLAAAHAGTKAPNGNAYRLTVPTGLVTEYPDASFKVALTSTALGTCAPSRVGMLGFTGFTALDGIFWFRDRNQVGTEPFGLTPRGWHMYWDSCDGGGLLNGTHGLLFVR